MQTGWVFFLVFGISGKIENRDIYGKTYVQRVVDHLKKTDWIA